jgi:hypothetical protein
MEKTTRDEYKMRYNISMNMDETWKVFDMDTDKVIANDYKDRQSALSHCRFLNREGYDQP